MEDLPLTALAEKVLGPKQEYLVVAYPNGDVIVYPWDPKAKKWGVALAGYRWKGTRLVLAMGRFSDPKFVKPLEEWARDTYAGVSL